MKSVNPARQPQCLLEFSLYIKQDVKMKQNILVARYQNVENDFHNDLLVNTVE